MVELARCLNVTGHCAMIPLAHTTGDELLEKRFMRNSWLRYEQNPLDHENCYHRLTGQRSRGANLATRYQQHVFTWRQAKLRSPRDPGTANSKLCLFVKPATFPSSKF